MKQTSIQENDIVLLQKGQYLKSSRIFVDRIQKFGRPGEKQMTINLEGAIGHDFGSTFKLVKQSQKNWSLVKVDSIVDSIELDSESGKDNRNIVDDGSSQMLTKEDIKELVDAGASGDQVIQTLVENNATFKSKTKFSQEKYISKKQRKYDDFVTLHRPTVRLLAMMYYSQEPLKICNLRIDFLSQLLSYANVQPGGNYLVFESGTRGLVTAAVLQRMGQSGCLIHVYSGTNIIREAVGLLPFTLDELSLLSYISSDNLPDFSLEDASDTPDADTCVKEENSTTDMPNLELEKRETSSDVIRKHPHFTRCRADDIKRAVSALRDGIDGLLIAGKCEYSHITKALLSYLKPGRSFVVFSPYKEPLVDLFMQVKNDHSINVKLVENFLRYYQVLPDRTHPEINMSGSGGFLLYGWKVAQ